MVQNIWKYSVPSTNDSIHQWTNSQWPHLIKEPFTNDPIQSMPQFNQRLPFNKDSFTNNLHSPMTHFWMTHSANDHIQSMTPLSSMTHSPMKLFSQWSPFTNTPFLNDPFTNVPILNDPFEWMAPIHQWLIQSITPLPSVNDPIQQWLIQNDPIQAVLWCRSFCQFWLLSKLNNWCYASRCNEGIPLSLFRTSWPNTNCRWQMTSFTSTIANMYKQLLNAAVELQI